MDPGRVAAYLERIGLGRPPASDPEGLRALHVAHLQCVPFENLSIALGEAIELGRDALSDKILDRRRGGFCFELNGLFAELLAALGFEAHLLGARVFDGARLGPPLSHALVRVTCPGVPGTFLADVGFGAHHRHPLALTAGIDQEDPEGTFRVERAGDGPGGDWPGGDWPGGDGSGGDWPGGDWPGGDWEVWREGALVYRIEARPRALEEFEAMCWYHQSSPRSRFTRTDVCSIATARGRATLSGDRLVVSEDGVRTESVLADDDERRAAYERHFGIVLARLPPRSRRP